MINKRIGRGWNCSSKKRARLKRRAERLGRQLAPRPLKAGFFVGDIELINIAKAKQRNRNVR
jgi:hypothetical protein